MTKMKLNPAALCVLLLTLGWASATTAAQAEPQASPEAAAGRPDQADGAPVIPAIDISNEIINTDTLLRTATSEVNARTNVEQIKQEFEAYRKTIESLRSQTRRQISRGGPAPVIAAARREWLHVEVKLNSWLNSLAAAVQVIDSYLERIDQKKAQWRKTRDESTIELPPALIASVKEVLDATNKVETALKTRRGEILSLQSRIGQTKADTVQILEDQKRTIAERRRAAWSIDSPPIWGIWSEPGDTGPDRPEEQWTWKSGIHSMGVYLQHITPRLSVLAVVFLGLVLLFRALRKRMDQSGDAAKPKPGAIRPFDRPYASAFIICLTAMMIMYPGAPPVWHSLVTTALVVAALRFTPSIIHPSKVVWAYLIGGVIVAWQVLQAVNVNTPTYRLTMVLLSGLGITIALLIFRLSKEASVKTSWIKFTTRSGALATGAFAVALLANLIGSLNLAAILTDGTLLAIFSAALLYLGVALVNNLVNAAIISRWASHLGTIRKSPETVRHLLHFMVRFLAVMTWIYILLNAYLIWDPVYETTANILQARLSVGNFSISLADVLIFVTIVWISLQLSKFLQFILANDVLPHMHLPRGAPDAIESLTHYLVIVLGVLAALSASGFDLSRIAIILGALGVGIGFGLQNIVNNFVSGLILLFERPIKLGDVVEIEGKIAVVKHITMRASIIRDYDGADIIVPNSDLISAKVVNWTYGSELRRIDIPVGVAYGTDPQQVIAILTALARENTNVVPSPAPEAFFMDFGDSSLDFQLRVWTLVDAYVHTGSELRVAIAHALKSANIQIPFPQRDIHVVPTDDSPERRAPAPPLPEKPDEGQSG